MGLSPCYSPYLFTRSIQSRFIFTALANADAIKESEGDSTTCQYSKGKNCKGLCKTGISSEGAGGNRWGGSCGVLCIDQVVTDIERPEDWTERPRPKGKILIAGDSISHGMQDDWTWRYRLDRWRTYPLLATLLVFLSSGLTSLLS